MSRFPIAFLAALVFCAAVHVPAQAAGDEVKLTGLWQEEADGYKIVWSIGYWDNAWTVKAKMHKEGEKPGSWQGADVRLADGKLTFTRKRGPDAPASVMDGAKMTVQLVKDGELSYTVGTDGPRTLTRGTDVALAPDARPPADGKPSEVVVSAPPKNPTDKPADKPTDKPGDKPTPKPDDKPTKSAGRTTATAEDAKRFGGVWAGEADGFKEVWSIKFQDDKCTLSAVYVDPKGKKTTFGMTGADIEFKDDKMHFVQKLGPGAPGHWFKNTKHTVEANRDSLSYSYFGGGRSLVKVPPAEIERSFCGTWVCEVDGYTEKWLIRKSGSKLQVGATLTAPGKKLSKWVGQDVKIADGKLTFTQKLGLNPPMGWEDKSQFTLDWLGAELSCNWVNGETKGETRYLKLVSK
ncbi:MAG TPA: PT domain-containing protein [Gemmataceae bacterium]|jgi:hypothetical protein